MNKRFLGVVVIAAMLFSSHLSLNAYDLSESSKKEIKTNSLLTGLITGAVAGMLLSENNKNLSDLQIIGLTAGASILGAISVGIYSYYNSYEKRFERNAQEHFEQAEQILNSFKMNESIQAVLKVKNVLHVDLWHLPGDGDSRYSSYPLISAYDFLKGQINRLNYVLNLIEQLHNCDAFHSKVDDHSIAVTYYLYTLGQYCDTIENSAEYQSQKQAYSDSLKPVSKPSGSSSHSASNSHSQSSTPI